MWVRLTPRRVDWVEHFSPDWLIEELNVERVQVSERVIDVRAPAIAWRIVRDNMRAGIFSHRGGIRKGLPATVTGALKAVAKPLGEMERHPALRQIGLIGHHADFFPVWPQARDDRDRIWSLYPNEGSFVVLAPEWTVIQGRKFTTWSPEGMAPEHRLTEEVVHLRLLRELH